MTVLFAVLAGVLFAAGSYLLMQRTLTRSVLAMALWGHAVNLVLLSAGGLAGEPPLVDTEDPDPSLFADPLAQAMALTAIVITFAIVVFLLALAYRSWTLTGEDVAEDDLEDRRIAEHAYQEVARIAQEALDQEEEYREGGES